MPDRKPVWVLDIIVFKVFLSLFAITPDMSLLIELNSEIRRETFKNFTSLSPLWRHVMIHVCIN